MLSNVENFIRNIFGGKTAGVQIPQDPDRYTPASGIM